MDANVVGSAGLYGVNGTEYAGELALALYAGDWTGGYAGEGVRLGELGNAEVTAEISSDGYNCLRK